MTHIASPPATPSRHPGEQLHCGVGISQSLKKNSIYRDIGDDKIALELAIREGVTGGDGQGNGLLGAFQISLLSGASFLLNSGCAFLTKDKNGAILSRNQDPKWPGTCVKATINYSKPLLLEQSLTINGRAFEPTDMLEILLMQSDDEDILDLCLVKEVKSIGSRSEGLRFRNKMTPLLKMSDFKAVRVDCAECSVLSGSFADDVFAKYCIEFGIDHFKKTIKLKNITPKNLKIIERSIQQRLNAGEFTLGG